MTAASGGALVAGLALVDGEVAPFPELPVHPVAIAALNAKGADTTANIKPKTRDRMGSGFYTRAAVFDFRLSVRPAILRPN